MRKISTRISKPNRSARRQSKQFYQKPFMDPRFFADNWVPEVWREDDLDEQF